MKRGCFSRNARARNTHVEATLNHPCAAQVGGDPPPEGWLAPVADDGTICGYGRYATKCADPTPGQVFIKNAVEGASPKGIAPPEKIVFTPLVETLSKKFAGAK